MPARFVRAVLETVPLEYWHGITAIELRARTGSVGEPFAFYRPSDRVVVMYSLPPAWTIPAIPRSLRRSLKRFVADVFEDGAGVNVSWRSSEVLALWFYCEVFAHELGHHRRHQYRQKVGPRGRRQDEEAVAELQSRRLTDQVFARIRAKRAARARPAADAPTA